MEAQVERWELTPEILVADYEAYKVSKSRSFAGPSQANRCSVLGHPCTAYTYYDRTVPGDQRREINAGLAQIFDEGREQERIIQRDLLEMGYDVSQQQGSLTWPAYNISGHRDFKISKGGSPVVRCEFKSVNPYIFDKLNTVEDVRTHHMFFIQKWYSQTVLYLLLEGQKTYWLFLKNKTSGRIKCLVFQWNDQMWEDAEALIKKAERINKLIQIGEKPTADEKISNPDDCARCEFFTACLPELNFGLAAKVLTDELAAEMQAKLDRHATLKPFSKEYEELDEELKGEIKSLTVDGSEDVVIGDWLAHVKLINVKAVPAKTVEAKAATTQKRISFTKVEQVSVSG